VNQVSLHVSSLSKHPRVNNKNYRRHNTEHRPTKAVIFQPLDLHREQRGLLQVELDALVEIRFMLSKLNNDLAKCLSRVRFEYMAVE
jgi:hypothetical protein